MGKITRTEEELNKAFRVEIKDFENCFSEVCKYNPLDEMREKKISDLALSLRKLIIDSDSMISLVTQMGIRNDILFYPICTFTKNDYAGNIIPVYPLIDAKYEKGRHFCSANLPKTSSNLRFDLDSWLREIVIDPKCEQPYKPSRYDVIRMVADKEGGAHYDKKHDQTYYEIINNYAYEIVLNDGTAIKLENNCYFETLLSISYEFLNAIKEYQYVKSLTKRKVVPYDFYVIETSYRFKDDETKHEHNKYVHSQNYSPLRCFELAFDLNGKASYRMIKTEVVQYFSVMENRFVQYLAFDFSRTNELVFLADMSKSETKAYMLLKNNKKYSFIKTNNDLRNIDVIRSYTFSQAIRLLSGDDEHLFDFSLSRQYVLEDKGIV